MYAPRFAVAAVVLLMCLSGGALAGSPVAPYGGMTGLHAAAGAHGLATPSSGIRPLAGGVTIIRPDGSLSNLSTPITITGNTYTITAGFTGSLIDQRNGSTLQGNGKVLNTSSGALQTLEVVNATHVLVEGFVITNASLGIYVLSSSSVNVSGNTIHATGHAFEALSDTWVTFSNNVAPSASGAYAILVHGLNVTGNDLHATSGASIDIVDSSDIGVAHNMGYGSIQGLLLLYSQQARVWGNNFSSTSVGVEAFTTSGATISWNNLSFDSEGLYLEYSYSISGTSNAGRNSGIGIYVVEGSSINLTNESFPAATSYGVEASALTNLTILSSNFAGSANGAVLDSCQQVRLAHDDFSGYVTFGVEVVGSAGVSIIGNSLANGTGSGGAAVYSDLNQQINVSDNLAPGSYSGFSDTSSTGVTVSGNDFAHSRLASQAVLLQRDRQVSVLDNNVFNASDFGLEAVGVQGLTIRGNNLSQAGVDGLLVDESGGVAVIGNTVDHAHGLGIGLEFVVGLTVRDNTAGFTGPFGVGFLLADSSSGTVYNNTATHSNISIDIASASGVQVYDNNGSASYTGLEATGDSNDTFVANQFWSDHYAFFLGSDSGIGIYHNNFVSDSAWSLLPAATSFVSWDSGYPGGGNFWSNHTGPDAMRGPGQNHSGSDGIVDTPVVMDLTNIDRYPLASPWVAYTITFTEQGLPNGMTWGVIVNGTHLSSSTSQIVYPQPDAVASAFGYQVAGVRGYVASPSSGGGAQAHANLAVSIAFAPVTYSVTFHVSGIASGAEWNLTFNGQTLTSTTPTIVVASGNGSFAYVVGGLPGYSATPNRGAVAVAGSPVNVNVTFTEVAYSVTFEESGLSGTTGWSVTFNGVTRSGNGAPIVFTVPNGTFSYTIGGVGGYSVSPSSGSESVTGGGFAVNVVFTTNAAKGYSATTVYGLTVGLIALALLAAAALVLWQRARRKPPTPAPAWSAAPAAAAPVPAPAPAVESPTPPPGASGGGASPPWKE
ncbi:MAG: right-handed parallel beta-helix repeat-containing protein [Thermoplasmata archaeon]|nr:right-handed parallel beta-helix repeat-containing protein [Thermoplasmata archaeon]